MKLPNTTSDGIDLSKWQRIQELALQYANNVMQGRYVAAEKARIATLRSISRLARQLGPRPSLLATRSDLVLSRKVQERLLLEAFRLAKRRNDPLNLTLIASSLATHYFEQHHDLKRTNKWLDMLENALEVHYDKGEAGVLRELRAKCR